MPFKNYITEEELKAYMPELARLLWSDEADYSRQGTEAVKTVISDLVNRGYDPVKLMPELVLKEGGNIITANETGESAEDKASARARFVYDVLSFGSTDEKTIILEGSFDNSAWTQIAAFTVTAPGIFSRVITRMFRYYRVKAFISGGSLNYSASLIETTYDRLITAKWLELILLDRYTEENDQYHLRMKYFRNEYEKQWDSIRIWSDDNEDGNLQSAESSKTTSIKMMK
jgi:hypothetical protein